MTTVLVCDDRCEVRERLSQVMSAVAGVCDVDLVANGDELLVRFAEKPTDVVLVGTHDVAAVVVEATRRLIAAFPEANVLVLGDPDDGGGIAAAILAGAHGYLRWGPLAHRPASASAGHQAMPYPRAAGYPVVWLSERERQVLRGMSRGRSNGQIGRELHLSEDTVKTHARRLFRKLGARDRAQAVALGFRQGLVS